MEDALFRGFIMSLISSLLFFLAICWFLFHYLIREKTVAQCMFAIVASPFIAMFLYLFADELFSASPSLVAFVLSLIVFLFAFIKELKRDAYRLMHYLLWQLPLISLLFFMSYYVLVFANIATLPPETPLPGEFAQVIPSESFFNFFNFINFFSSLVLILFLGKYIPKYKKFFFLFCIMIFFAYFPFFKSIAYKGILYLLLIIPFGLIIGKFILSLKKSLNKGISLKTYFISHKETLAYFIVVSLGIFFGSNSYLILTDKEVDFVMWTAPIILPLFFTGLQVFLDKIPFSFSNIVKKIFFFFKEMCKIYFFLLIIDVFSSDGYFFRSVGVLFYPFLLFLCIKDLQLNKSENLFISLKDYLRYVFPLFLLIVFLFLSSLDKKETEKFIQNASQFQTIGNFP